jgi:hypothetical protein
MIELTNIELFKSLVSLELDKTVIDLHNDYDCTSLQYKAEERLLEFCFEVVDGNSSTVIVRFEGATVSKFNLLRKATKDACTLNNFYRGRFEVNGKLLEYSPLGERYYYIEFEDGDVFEVLAQEVFLLRKG